MKIGIDARGITDGFKGGVGEYTQHIIQSLREYRDFVEDVLRNADKSDIAKLSVKDFRRIAQGKNNIKLLGRLSDEEAQWEFRECKAFIFASEDDFGIVPVEAMAVGKPVIAY